MLNAMVRTRPSAVSKPTENQATQGSAQKKGRDHVAVPIGDNRFGRRVQQVAQCGTCGQGKQSHFEPIEHPAEERSDQHIPLDSGELVVRHGWPFPGDSEQAVFAGRTILPRRNGPRWQVLLSDTITKRHGRRKHRAISLASRQKNLPRSA